MRVDSTGALSTFRSVVRNCYDVTRDSSRLKAMLPLSPAEQAAGFDRLRRDYPVRREFAACEGMTAAPGASSAETFRRLGFRLQPA